MQRGFSDEELVAHCLAKGDQHSFEILVRRHQSPVRNFALRLTGGNHALSDDVAQETFINAYRKLESFKGKGSFRSWLYQIAYNNFLQDRRRNKRYDTGLEDRELEEMRPAAEHSKETAARLDVEKAMRGLTIEERTAITLCFTNGLSHTEASDVMQMPLGTVKSHIARGKDKLRVALQAWQPGN